MVSAPACSRGRASVAFARSLSAAFYAASRFPRRATPVGLPFSLELGIPALRGVDSTPLVFRGSNRDD